MKVLIHDLLLASRKGGAPGEQFIGHHSKGILITGRSRFAAPDFWCHVCRCATNGAADACSRVIEPGDAKIREEQIWAVGIMRVGTDEKIGGFDILVDKLFIVGILKRISSLTDKIGDILYREHIVIGTPMQPVSKRTFRAKGHDNVDEGRTIDLLLAVTKQGQNMRMIEPGNSPGFALEETDGIFSNIAFGIG